MKKPSWDSYWNGVQNSFVEKKIQQYKAKTGYQKLLDAVPEIKANGRCLEVGAGKAWISRLLKGRGWHTTGLDNNERIVKDNAQFLDNYVVGDIFSLPFANQSFDLVLSCGLLEHFELKTVEKIAEEMKRVGQSVVAWLPTCGIEWKTVWFIRNLLGGDVYAKSYTHSRNDLETLFKTAGFNQVNSGVVKFAGFLRYIYIYSGK